MAKFEKGNQFWKNRSKHGRDKLFKSPELLWEAACEYFQWVDDNPLMETKAMTVSGGKDMGSSIELQEIPCMRPYTLIGLCLYLNASASYFRQFKSTITESTADFLTVINKIEEVIYNHKFEGAASGFLDSRIIARDLGLTDKKEVDNKGGQTITIQRTIVTRDESKP